jgi:hypothetical protein
MTNSVQRGMGRVLGCGFFGLFLALLPFLFVDITIAANPDESVLLPKASKTSLMLSQCTEDSESIQTDLSGNYQGNVEYPSAALYGEAVLEVASQQHIDKLRFNPFTLRTGGSSPVHISGKLIAITTCGYTTVTMLLDSPSGEKPAKAHAPTILSLRACKSGKSFRLQNATEISGQRRLSFSATTASIDDSTRWGRCGRPH